MKKLILMVSLLICSVWAGEWKKSNSGGVGNVWNWYSDCFGILSEESVKTLTRQKFENEFKNKALWNILGDICRRYDELEDDWEAIRRISNENTKMAQIDQLVQKLTNMCANSNSPQCAEIKEKIAPYKQCIAKLNSEWDSFTQGAKKIQAEAEKIAADNKARNITNGRSNADIMGVFRQNGEALSYTYKLHLEVNPGLSGRITVKCTIDEFGNVIDGKLVSSTTKDDFFDQTILKVVMGWNFGEIDISGDITEFEKSITF